MGTSGLPDICTLSPRACGPRALGVYIRQTTRAHGITIKCVTLRGWIKAFCRAIYLILPCFEGNIRYIALKPGQYLDIAREGGFWPAFDQSIDLPFDLQGTVMKTSFLI